MIYHPTKRLAILTPPRTASRAVREALAARHGFEEVAKRHEIEWYVLDNAERIRVVVRDHAEALASWWFLEARKPEVLIAGPGEWLLRTLRGETGVSNWLFQFGEGLAIPSDELAMWAHWFAGAALPIRYEALETELEVLLGEPVALSRINHKPGRPPGVTALDVFGDEGLALIERTFATERRWISGRWISEQWRASAARFAREDLGISRGDEASS